MTSPINLTDAEREKFAAYCRQEAETSKGVVAQINKVGLPALVGDTLVQREKLLIAAHAVVAERLLSGEETGDSRMTAALSKERNP